MKKVVIIDNYDSFTYNLVHLINEVINGQVTVFKNDNFSISDLDEFDYIILSPGPGLPDDAGLLKEVIRKFAGKKKILGVCLGLQAIGEVYGAELKNLPIVYHGMKTRITQTTLEDPILKGIQKYFDAGRYHSWVINKATCPEVLLITSVDEQSEIMSARHRDFQVFGVQFHPESIMTPDGKRIIENFLSLE